MAYKKKKPTSRKSKAGKDTYPHFRRYNIPQGRDGEGVRHPKLIIEKKGDKYGYLGLTKQRKSGHHNNFPLKKNPKKGESFPSYLRRDYQYDQQAKFGKILEDYQLSNEDKKRVIAYVQALKEKKKK